MCLVNVESYVNTSQNDKRDNSWCHMTGDRSRLKELGIEDQPQVPPWSFMFFKEHEEMS